MEEAKNRKLIVIGGPTASGKSHLAMLVARAIDSEVISADSMQAYKELEFITFPPLEEMSLVSHHLAGFLDPEIEYNAAKFVELSRHIIDNLWRGNKTPIVCGGTGMYIKALLNGMFEAKGDEVLRKQLYEEARIKGASLLYERLKEVDASSAGKIHPNDVRRIVRALEVFFSTGKPISQWHAQSKGINDEAEVFFFCLMPDNRQWLKQRIARRIDENITLKSLDQLKGIRNRLGKTAQKAIGVRELSMVLDNEISFHEAMALMKKNTYQYARRQMIWFRAQKQAILLDPSRSTPNELKEEILNIVSEF